MPILVSRDNMPKEVCWDCGLRFSEDESIIYWDALRAIFLHAKCALEAGQRLLSDAQQALDMDNVT